MVGPYFQFTEGQGFEASSFTFMGDLHRPHSSELRPGVKQGVRCGMQRNWSISLSVVRRGSSVARCSLNPVSIIGCHFDLMPFVLGLLMG